MDNINLINLDKIAKEVNKFYPKITILVGENFRKKELTQVFISFKIPHQINQKLLGSQVYFGSQVRFKALYLLAAILKNYGIVEMRYNPNLKEKITLGSRKRIQRADGKPNYISVLTQEILDLSPDTSFYEFSRNSLSSYQEIKLTEDSEDNPTFDDFDNIDIEYHNNYYDPYEDFHWGGLSGEEAYIGYWNTE